jgi:single-strand DNA-binding protein
MIKTEVIGHLGNDAVVNNVNGKSVVNFSVAHTEKYKDSNGVETTNTIWVSCSYWAERIGVATYLKRGTQVYVEGQPSLKTYVDNQNKTQAQLSLRVRNIQLLGGAKQEQVQPQQNNYPSNPQDVLTDKQKEFLEQKDDLPF